MAAPSPANPPPTTTTRGCLLRPFGDSALASPPTSVRIATTDMRTEVCQHSRIECEFGKKLIYPPHMSTAMWTDGAWRWSGEQVRQRCLIISFQHNLKLTKKRFVFSRCFLFAITFTCRYCRMLKRARKAPISYDVGHPLKCLRHYNALCFHNMTGAFRLRRAA